MHHANAVLDGVLGAGQSDPFAIDGDGALVGLVQAVEDVHQGRLAGTVATEQPVHLTGVQGQVDVVQGGDVAEALGDVGHHQASRWGVLIRPGITRARGLVLGHGRGSLT
ncbi:Uncharacterised protein [Mycobacteroides abscessus subsp. abscessus]|nr:Uncharacterised protein [Mycobacteroides abscessus subsp. abscessus]